MKGKDKIRESIERAFLKVIKNDYQLLENNVNERSLTHKMAIYLGEEFPEYHIDCEYNRNGLDAKRLQEWKRPIESDDIEGKTVYPDIIIHHRGTFNNFIVIEAKKSSNNDETDIKKLKAYKKDLDYQHAFFVKFPVGKDFSKFKECEIKDYVHLIKDDEE